MARLIQRTPEEIKIIGEINIYNANTLVSSFKELKFKVDEITINCRKITHSKSIALAVLLEIKKLSIKKNKKVTFNYLPTNLKKIAKISNLDVIL